MAIPTNMSDLRQKAFEQIYSNHAWGGGSRSGPGSDPEHTGIYVHFVNQWLEHHSDSKSIVELGCGDWATTSRIEIKPNHSYFGFDIVPDVIASNQERFTAENLRFECRDFISNPPPGADLLLIKDVLQHLSNESVHEFLRNILPRFHYAIITNDVDKYVEFRKFGIVPSKQRRQEANCDTEDGGSRPLKLDEAPFNLRVCEKATYSVRLQNSSASGASVFQKEILVWHNTRQSSI